MRIEPVCFFVLIALVGPVSSGCPDIDFTDFDMPPWYSDAEPPGLDFAVESGLSGKVTLDVHVLEDGRVCEVETVGETDRLTALALQGTRRARFAPAEKDGRWVPGVVTVTFEYVLPEIRSHPAILDIVPPMISERAEHSRRSEWKCDEKVPVFSYHGVVFYGDISVRDYETLLDLVAEHTDENHVVGRVHHYLWYPDECRDGPTFAGDRSDAGIEIFWRADAQSAPGGSSTTYHFVNDGGDYRLFPVTTKTTACFTTGAKGD